MGRTLGLKLTHDAAVALIEDGRLIFMNELEKIGNAPRYTSAKSAEAIRYVLETEGVALDSLDAVVIDGWKHGRIASPAFSLGVAPYHEHDFARNEDRPNGPLASTIVSGISLLPPNTHAISYQHVTGHVLGSYMTAPFAGEPARVIVWDGGIVPRLYDVDPQRGVRFVKQLGKLSGLIYGIMGYYAGPYKRPDLLDGSTIPTKEAQLFGGRDVPGKLMSWIGLGVPRSSLIERANRLYRDMPDAPLEYAQTSLPEHAFVRTLRECAGASDEDFLASLHSFLEGTLVHAARSAARGQNLVFTGGCALNIKWNSALRSSGGFRSVWVPPFPNDSGSAFGAAAAHEFHAHFRNRIEWGVYRGPRLGPLTDEIQPWAASACSLGELADILCTDPLEPVVFLYGRAELGPRALGHRSIFMNPMHLAARSILNKIKRREDWRPVAPIVLEEDAPRFFHPGTRDPYMLFDHDIKANGVKTLPAIMHMDGTARIQTVGHDGCAVVRHLLQEFKKRSGVGVLCNTSANLLGSGFFPDVDSAMRWGGANYIWADGNLYERLKP